MVGGPSKDSGGITGHPVMSVWVDFEGSLRVEGNGRRMDGYWIAADDIVDDPVRIVKGTASVPALHPWGA